jgi:serine/threonine protein kinase
VPPGSAIMGSQVGNQLWRSPEAHAQGPVNSSSDIFSFGIVVSLPTASPPFLSHIFSFDTNISSQCIYAILRTVIFAPSPEELEDPDMEPLSIILERQLSYFAEPDTLDALLRHLGPESPWCEIFTVVHSGFNTQNPRKPFHFWKSENPGFDQDFKDLVGGMTNFDPAMRITAREALAHKWFADVEG